MEELESEARKLHARLLDERRLSLLDTLTGVPNRLAYEQRIADEIERWRRFAQPTCIAAWDIDRFKQVNDSYGHGAGDKVLTVVAECLANSIRTTDFVARYGGEEFVMILPGTTTPVSVTISCGITALCQGDTSEAAFERADKAMYKAKEAGRNRTVESSNK
jgi:diguanylate cyclase